MKDRLKSQEMSQAQTATVKLPKQMTGLWCVSSCKKLPGGGESNLSTWTRNDRRGRPCKKEGDTEWLFVQADGSYSGPEYGCKAIKLVGGNSTYTITLSCD